MSGGYVLLLLADKPDLPADLWLFLVAMLGLYLVAHLAVRRFAPHADPTLLPIAALLNGIGFITISRLDRDLARVQAGWTAVAVVAFVVVLVVRASRPHPRAIPIHVPAPRRRARWSCPCSPESGVRSTAPGCGYASGR